jgi:phenylalanyl-tRNA synthetase alpha chain
MSQNIVIQSEEERRLKELLETRHDPEAERMKRFIAMPDLSRTPGSPLHEMVSRILGLEAFQKFDTIKIPEIVSTEVSFDLFDFPADHPARSKSDTYYVDSENILRTHTTVMWYYYLRDKAIKKKMAAGEAVGAFSFGKVYRKDEIDRNHLNVFHQMDGWYLAPRATEPITEETLKTVLADIAKAVFGPDIKYRFNPDKFPYTDPSIEMEIDKGGKWIEVLGAGVVKGSVLDKLGVDSSVYSGWAFGFGLERLAIISMDLPDIRLLWSSDERVKKQLKLGQKFVEVSKFPPVVRDISFVVPNTFIPNDYFDLIRDVGKDMVENVELIDKYENVEKFGADKVSYTYRVTYRHLDKTLTNEEVNQVHAELENRTEKEFTAQVRRV